jgi:beta-ribofuranosylaminobenzene 5'-phosphate synthase
VLALSVNTEQPAASAPAKMDCETLAPAPLTDRADRVTVRAPGRLHLGFLDPSGTLGRSYGSLGLVIDGFETVVSVAAAAHDEVVVDDAAAHPDAARALRFLDILKSRTGHGDPVRLHLHHVLPAHAGFGSGTQLALAVGHAFARWHGLAPGSATLANWLGRGARSGIGIAGFDQGGLLVEGGPGSSGMPAPLLARVDLPREWRVVVVQDERPAQAGLSGHAEATAIATLPPLPRDAAADICHQVLMRVLPGAACGDFMAFAAGVTRVQQVLGAHFAPAQGGSPYTSAAVGRLVRWLADAADGGAAIGQSSWGPTGFAVLSSQARAETLVRAARAAGQVGATLNVRIVAARSRGGSIVGAGRP